MPFLAGLILRAAGKLLKGWWIPLAAAVSAWVLEQLTGVITWGVFLIAQAVADLLLEVLASATWPASPNWAVLSDEMGTGVTMLSEAGVLGAAQIIVVGGIVRLTVRLLTLGRL